MPEPSPEASPWGDLFGKRDRDAELIREASLNNAIKRATPFRRGAAIGATVVLVVSIAPLTLTPLASLIAGIVGVALVVLTICMIWRSRLPGALSSGDDLVDALGRTLRLSRRIQDREEQGNPLNEAEHAEVLELVRREVGEALKRSRLWAQHGSAMYVPELPLPRAAEQELRMFVHNHRYNKGVLRSIGTAWLALGFTVVWTSVLMIVWGLDSETCEIGVANCAGAFQGLSANPAPGDFLYFVVTSVRGDMPPDLIARSRAAHLAFVATFVSGVVLIAKYAADFWTSTRSQILAAEATSQRS